MTAAWRKVTRDLWQRGSRTRTLLVVLALATGLAGFGSVLATYAILDRELETGYRATNPAAATLWTDAIDDELLAAVRATPGVREADARRMVTGRIKVGPVEWRTLLLIAPRDFGDVRVSRFRSQQGAWPPDVGEVLIERDAIRVARANIGDTVTVKMPAGTDQTMRISGTVHDPGQVQARMENVVYGYVTSETLTLLGEQARPDQLRLTVADGGADEAEVRGVVVAVTATLEGAGHPVRRSEVAQGHPHADLMGLLLLVQAGFGGFVLALSALLALHLVTAQMAGQVRQIGVMQALGATRWQTARPYLTQALLMGLAAFIVAAPVSIAGGRLLARVMGVYLNFDITSAAVPAWVLLLEGGTGLILPLLAAAYPVWRATRLSVREAIADFGGRAGRNAFGTSAFDRALARMGGGGVARPLLLSIRNTGRRRLRLALTLVTLVVGGLSFMTALNVRASMVGMLDALFSTRKYDLSVTLGGMYPFERIERAALATPGVVAAEGWITTQAAIVAPGRTPAPARAHTPGLPMGGHGGGTVVIHGSGGGASDRFTTLGVPAGTRMHAPNLEAGRALAPDDTDAIVVNSPLARREGIRVGGEIRLQMGPAEQVWSVVGISREPFSPPLAYVPRAYFERAGHMGMANSVRLALEPRDRLSVARVRADLDRNLEREGVRALASLGTADGRFAFDQHFAMIYDFLIVVAVIILGVGGVGLASTMGLAVLERRRELGVLQAIGASPRAVWFIVVGEGLAVGVAGWALAAVGAWPASRAAGELAVRLMFSTGLDLVFDLRGPVLWLVMSVVVGAAASLLPAWRATRLTVRDALACG